MSSYLVIQQTSSVLAKLLKERIAESGVRAASGQQIEVSANTPTELIRTGKGQLSFWLYKLAENAYTRNALPDRANGSDLPPLPLNLHFLVTPITKSADVDLMVMGKVLQVFYENPIVLLRNEDDADLHDQITIQLERTTVDEQSRIWEALSEPYRLSVSYLVQIARIDAQRTAPGALVVDRQAGFPNGVIPAGGR